MKITISAFDREITLSENQLWTAFIVVSALVAVGLAVATYRLANHRNPNAEIPTLGSIQFRVQGPDQKPIAGAQIVITDFDFDSQSMSKFELYTTDSGECLFERLPLDHNLQFEVRADGYRTEVDARVILSEVRPTSSWEIHLQPMGAPGDLVWQNHLLRHSQPINLEGSVFQVQANGSFKRVTAADGLTCTIVDGANNISLDMGCNQLFALKKKIIPKKGKPFESEEPGCALIKANIGNHDVTSVVRIVGPNGENGGYCSY